MSDDSGIPHDCGDHSYRWAKDSPSEGDHGLRKWNRYQQSKRSNLAFTYALADYIEKKGSKVLSLCSHPGATNSGLQSRTQADVSFFLLALGGTICLLTVCTAFSCLSFDILWRHKRALWTGS